MLFDAWLQLYGVRHWVVESDGFNAGFQQDARLKAWTKANQVHIEPHQTRGIKHDPLIGVGSYTALFRDDLIDLPYGDSETRQKVGLYLRQLYNFTDDAAKQRRRRADLAMAGWFPNKAIRRLEKEAMARAAEVQSIDSHYPTSYPRLTNFTTMNQAPWR